MLRDTCGYRIRAARGSGTCPLTHADFAIATDGIAGPTGATQNLPVGSVWIAVASASGVKSQLFTFGNAGGRNRIIYRAAIRALDLVRRELENGDGNGDRPNFSVGQVPVP